MEEYRINGAYGIFYKSNRRRKHTLKQLEIAVYSDADAMDALERTKLKGRIMAMKSNQQMVDDLISRTTGTFTKEELAQVKYDVKVLKAAVELVEGRLRTIVPIVKD
jgi:hypothetical protein